MAAAMNSDTTVTTPTSIISRDSEITGAHRKITNHQCCNTRFVLSVPGSLRYEWPLPDGLIAGYIFDDTERCVTLYKLADPGLSFTNDMPHITYSAEGWKMSRAKIWKDMGMAKTDGYRVFKNIDTLFKWFLLEDRLAVVHIRL